MCVCVCACVTCVAPPKMSRLSRTGNACLNCSISTRTRGWYCHHWSGQSNNTGGDSASLYLPQQPRLYGMWASSISLWWMFVSSLAVVADRSCLAPCPPPPPPGAHAVVAGGGIFTDNGVLTISESTFVGNTVQQFGGGIYANVFDGEVDIANTTFVTNSAGYGGGGLGFQGVQVSVTDSLFEGNVAEEGGAVNFQVATSVRTADCVFHDNAGIYGGAMLLVAITVAEVTACQVANNTASVYGGGIVSQANGLVVANGGSAFFNNSAGLAGGAWTSFADNATVWDDVLFEGNAAFDAGAIGMVDVACANVSRCLFDRNRAVDGPNAGNERGRGKHCAALEWLDVSIMACRSRFHLPKPQLNHFSFAMWWQTAERLSSNLRSWSMVEKCTCRRVPSRAMWRVGAEALSSRPSRRSSPT